MTRMYQFSYVTVKVHRGQVRRSATREPGADAPQQLTTRMAAALVAPHTRRHRPHRDPKTAGCAQVSPVQDQTCWPARRNRRKFMIVIRAGTAPTFTDPAALTAPTAALAGTSFVERTGTWPTHGDSRASRNKIEVLARGNHGLDRGASSQDFRDGAHTQGGGLTATIKVTVRDSGVTEVNGTPVSLPARSAATRVRFGCRNMLPGVLDDALLADWCLRYLGVPLNRVFFRSG